MRLYRICLDNIEDPTSAARETVENIPNCRIREVRHFGKTQMLVSFIRPDEVESQWGVTDTDRMLLAWLRRCLEGDLKDYVYHLVEFNVYESGDASWPARKRKD